MRDPKVRPVLLSAICLGLALLAGWIVAWRLFSDAAGFFAPVLAAVGVGCLALAGPASRRSSLVAGGLRLAGGGGVGLAVCAALSLGAFLPFTVADWISPALGRFGGGAALAILAVALSIAAFRARRWGWQPDALVLLGTGASWVWAQTMRQEAFPPTPTTATVLAPRLRVLLLLGAVLGVCALPLWRRWPRAARWCWRWGGVAALLGLAASMIARTDTRWACTAVLAALLIGGAALGWRPRGVLSGALDLGRGAGWLALVLVAVGAIYAATAEDLEVVFLRNTAERRAVTFWRGVIGDERANSAPGGTLAGLVRDRAGRPLGGASVVMADAAGRVFSATSNADGRYRLAGVPAGNYLPMAVAPAYRQGGRSGWAGRVATIRAGRTTGGVDFRLTARIVPEPGLNESLTLGEPAEVTYEGLIESTVVRRTFTFANRGLVLEGGLVHEPRADLGTGPFPILLIIYPGEADSWEGVSAPLAAEGYVVVSYFPRRLLDLEGDLDDLRLLLNLTAAGRLSARGDGSRVVLVGGSVSTVYTYLLARAIDGEPVGRQVRALIQYGGLYDMFTFRYSWESGQVTIDPGISELEYLLAAFGRPDTRPELYLRFSPRFGVGPGGLPPTLLTHAEKDIIVPPDQSHLAADGLAAAGIPHQLLLYPDLEHYLDVSKRDPEQLDMLERTLTFLREWTGAAGR